MKLLETHKQRRGAFGGSLRWPCLTPTLLFIPLLPRTRVHGLLRSIPADVVDMEQHRQAHARPSYVVW